MTFVLPRHKYTRTVRRPYPPFYASMIFAGSADPQHYLFVLKKPSVISNCIVCDSEWYYVTQELRACGRAAFREWNNKRIVARVQKVFFQRERALIRAAQRDFDTYIRAYEQYMPVLQTIWNLDSFIAVAVRRGLRRKLSSDAAQEMMDTLNIPLQNNFYKQEEYDLLQTQDIQKHIRNYEWINSRYGEVHPYTVAEARAKRTQIDRNVFISEWTAQKKKVRMAIREAKKILGRSAYLVDLMQFIVYYRTQRTDTMHRSSYLFAPELARMARTCGITYQQMLHCTKNEILNGIPSRVRLNERIRAHATIIDRGVVTVLIGKDYERMKTLLNEDIVNVRQLSGSIASSGRATGTAKIILGRDDFEKIKKGDILVASMTTPQMVAIMKKAAAFVTDEGGITCHAAIISRELKKPCIIGTKVATRVLKDGDRVEVDATKGIVRKI